MNMVRFCISTAGFVSVRFHDNDDNEEEEEEAAAAEEEDGKPDVREVVANDLAT
jgi:hypothetical protein